MMCAGFEPSTSRLRDKNVSLDYKGCLTYSEHLEAVIASLLLLLCAV